MTFQERLRKVVQRSVEGPAWHGPSVLETLEGVTAEQAATQAIPNLHTIWELVLHIAAWMEETAVRIEGGFNEQPLRGNFPEPGEPSEENWQATREILASSLAQLIAAIERLPEEALLTRVSSSDGPSVVIADMLAGAAEHNTYHAGQIVVLRKVLEAADAAVAQPS